jgi:hypothetical protein
MTVPKAAQSDNKLAERAGWDMALLKLEFEEILKLDSEFDLTVTGIELGELDVILDAGSDPTADAIPEIDPKAPAITRPGDLWLLGKHRLVCGDARSAESYARLKTSLRAPGQPTLVPPLSRRRHAAISLRHHFRSS